ncbi:hypothetical protein [Mangrovihabitans endophyticus]|uniref:Lipoprotein n=1 Tax=Mangrovihabitans endophyticus TaxID=1751298 RepID=A0A8J3BW01_9ACTN|nr:hypothetical protein [Mangrovihabitans endophyticus]GGK73621.1 hypothetical protein GCM10012284_04380 [Mangrovihabitans endophyticus]
MTVLVATTLLVSGCHAADPHRPPGITADQSTLLDRAEQFLIRDCMRRHGFAYTVVPRATQPRYRDFPYVVDDPGWARAHGYGTDLLRRRDAAARAEPNTRRWDRMPESTRAAALFALNGMPGARTDLTAVLPSGVTTRRSATSCTSQAERRLYDDLPTWYRATRVTENLAPVRIRLVADDARFRRAVARWGRCMADAGHDYDTPALARAAVLSAVPPMPRRREVALAVTEATCAGQTGLSGTARRLDRQYARTVDGRYATAIADRKRLQRTAIPRAQAVVLAR